MAWNIDTDYSFADMYIGKDEFVLWKGRPEKGITFAQHELVTVPFGIFFTAFAVFWILMALPSGPLALFGVPFVLVGLYLAGGRFIVSEIMKRKTAYVITNKAIIRKRGSSINVWYREQLNNMQVYSHKNGTTSFMFSLVPIHYSGRANINNCLFGIENVRDAKDVSEAIKTLKS